MKQLLMIFLAVCTLHTVLSAETIPKNAKSSMEKKRIRFFEQRRKHTSGKRIILLIMIINRLKIGMEEKLKQAENMDGLQKTEMCGYLISTEELIHRIGMSNIRMEHIILYIQYHQIPHVALNKKR